MSGVVPRPTAVAVIPVYPTSSSLVNFPINVDRGSLGLDKDTLICGATSALWQTRFWCPARHLSGHGCCTSLLIVKTGMKYQQVN